MVFIDFETEGLDSTRTGALFSKATFLSAMQFAKASADEDARSASSSRSASESAYGAFAVRKLLFKSIPYRSTQ